MWNRRGYAAISMDLYGKLPSPGIPATERTSAFFLNVYDKDGAVAPQGDAWPVSSEYIERP